jgi:NTP pyrophosphatase (non-canonical NTP hydrolase)
MCENAINEVIDAAILVLSEELGEIVREKRRKHGCKCRNWISHTESLGASNCLFHELSSEDRQEYKKTRG